MANHGQKQYQAPDAVGTIVAQSPLKAAVFQKHGIDFCCGGGMSLTKACEKHGLDLEQVRGELEAIVQEAPPARDWTQEEDLEVIIDYILKEFHEPLGDDLPRLGALMDRVTGVHGDRHPELHEMRALYGRLAEELFTHMQKEERILFPIMRTIQQARNKATELSGFHCGSVQNPIQQMEVEHEDVGEVLRQLRAKSDDFTLPDGACNSYRALWAGLEHLETELHRHIHLENFVLQPLAVTYERELT